jgi:hypothetical protein
MILRNLGFEMALRTRKVASMLVRETGEKIASKADYIPYTGRYYIVSSVQGESRTARYQSDLARC